MTMEQAIRDFHTQFSFEPEAVHAEKLLQAQTFVVNGMGGSHLAGDILQGYDPAIDLHVVSKYGVPKLSDESLDTCLFIASSYSGNTEEVIDFAEEVYARGHHLAVIATGGKLLEFAQKNTIPHIVLPSTGIQPRSALGFLILAMARLIGASEIVAELRGLEQVLEPSEHERDGQELATALAGHVPVIYASERNKSLAYNWKIKFNETGKIPAFYNVFPELNHNEMTGYDYVDANEALSKQFHFIFLADTEDHPRIQRRMEVCQTLYEEKGLSVTKLMLTGNSRFERMFNSLLLADWTALHTARQYGSDAEQVPMVEDFKKML